MDVQHLPDRSLKLTVVEDDPIILHDIRMMVESIGHSVHSAYHSGEKLLESGPPYTMDMLLVDIELEGSVNGIEAVASILQSRTVPVIYLTSYSDNDTFKKILQTNPYGYILKPAKREQLKIAVDIAYYKFTLDRLVSESEKRYHSIVETLPLMIARFVPGSNTITFCNGFFQEFFDSSPSGDNFFSLMAERKFVSLDSFFSGLTAAQAQQISEIQIEYAGDELWFRIFCQALFDDDMRIFEYQFMAEDITRRKRSEEEITTKTVELNSRIRDLNCLYSISNILEKPRSLDYILQRIVDELAVALNDNDNVAVCIEYGDRSLFSYNYFSTTPNYNNPIVVNNCVVGNIRLNISEEKRLRCFISEEEEELLSTVSELISKTVVKIESEEQLKKLEREIIMISEREKQNLGHELHDGIGQILTGASFLLKTLEKQYVSAGSRQPQELTEIGTLIRDATTRCRRLSKGLVPVSYSNETFVYLVEQLLHSAKELYQLDFIISIPEEFSLKTSFATSQLFRIVQEAVNNIVKHADATGVNIAADDNGHGVTLSISDNGIGVHDILSRTGLGMNIMKYRADLVNAGFEVFSEENCGTVILVHLPEEIIDFF